MVGMAAKFGSALAIPESQSMFASRTALTLRNRLLRKMTLVDLTKNQLRQPLFGGPPKHMHSRRSMVKVT